MRFIANTRRNNKTIVRLMINQSKEGIYVFEYDTIEDYYCLSDYIFDTIEDAKEFTFLEFGVTESDWKEIKQEAEGCQQDWIEDVVRKEIDGKSVFVSKITGEIKSNK